MQLNSQYLQNKNTKSQPSFGLLEMNPRKIARRICPQGGDIRKKFEQETKYLKLILQARTKGLHAFVDVGEDYDGVKRIDIAIQELTPRQPKTDDLITDFFNWLIWRSEVKNKSSRIVEYAHFKDISDFAANAINKTDELKRRFYAGNRPRLRPPAEFMH